MPLFYEKIIDEKCSLCIWEITESLEELLEISQIHREQLEKAGKKNLKRQLEWVAIRLLLKKMLGYDKKIELNYDEYGKPHLNGINKHISVSHTKQFVSVITHDNKHAGIDIEMIAARIQKISERFLGKKEYKWTQKNPSLEQLFIIWGAKESAFKIYSEGGIDFKEMLEVEEFGYAEKGKTKVALKKNNVNCAYPVWWEHLGELMLVYAIEN